MRFSISAVLALGTAVRNSDAFLSPTLKTRTTAIHMDKDFLDALSPQSGDDNSEEKDDGSGSSRFRELMKLAKESGQSDASSMQPAIDNPFLSQTPLPANPDGLSVEEQARMFREMMADKQGFASPPPPTKVNREADRAGRPVGRNKDADKIANTSDLYFAQLKRDSTVRTIGRYSGDEGVSEAVFEDDGIQELDDLFLENPFLQTQKEEERKLLDSLPEGLVAPYFRTEQVDLKEFSKSGISYKERLMQKRQDRSGGASTPVSTPAPAQEIPQASVVEVPPPQTPSPPEPEQEYLVPQASAAPSLPAPQQQEPPSPAPVAETQKPEAVTSNDGVRRQNLRTLMGLLLKHRGGSGFGKGRLKGPDVDLFEGLVEEITNMLRNEANQPSIDTPGITIVEETPAVVTESPPVQAAPAVSQFQPETPVAAASASSSAESADIDSTIACIEGAITMYTNSPPAIQGSVLGVLRAALMSAVDTCNIALAQPAPPVPASPDASVAGMVACIEGAVTMYKNSPPALKESVLVTLRMAMMSAVATCDAIISPGQVAPPVAVVEAPPAPVVAPPVAVVEAPPAPAVAPPVAVVEPPPAVAPPVAVVETPPAPEVAAPVAVVESSPPASVEMDTNSAALEEIYQKLQSASGDGKLGLRSDLAAGEAKQLADELVKMRDILMGELQAGIPAEQATESSPAPAKAASKDSSATSRYQIMLAKAKAEKAAEKAKEKS